MYYHLSANYLGEEYTFKPRIPKNGYLDASGHIIEDQLTPRVCFSKKMYTAYLAIPDDNERYCVYVANKLPGFIDPYLNIKSFYNLYKYKYDHNFIFKRFKDKIIGHNKKVNNKMIKSFFKGLVPDVKKTKEVWSTKKVKAKFYGIYCVKSKRIIRKKYDEDFYLYYCK